LAVTMVTSVATFWVLTLSPWLIDKGIDPEFWMLVVAILFVFGVAVLFEYRVTFPSFYSTWNEQMWKHDSPIKKEFDDLNERFDNLEKLIKGGKDGSSI